jgi:uncharacterized protein (DUF2384 family)
MGRSTSISRARRAQLKSRARASTTPTARMSRDEAERIVKVAERFVAAVGALIGSS